MEERKALCFRCEYRAQYLETGSQPRCECGMDWGVGSCYMYRPTKPYITIGNDKDSRPRFAGFLFSSRERALRPAKELTPRLYLFNNSEVVIVYVPEFKYRFKMTIFVLKQTILSYLGKITNKITYWAFRRWYWMYTDWIESRQYNEDNED